MSSLDDEMRKSVYYKYGYLKGAARMALEMIKNGSVAEAETRLEDALQILCEHGNQRMGGQGTTVICYCKDCGKELWDKDVS